MYDNASVGNTGGGGSAARAMRLDLACDAFGTSDEIVAAAGEVSSDLLIVLHITPKASADARHAVVDARKILAGRSRRVRVLIGIPETADGTDVFRGGSSDVLDVLALTDDLKATGADLGWAVTLTRDAVWRTDSIFSLAREKQVMAILLPSSVPMPEDAQLFAWDFVTYYLLEEFRAYLGDATIAYYEALQAELYHNRLGKQQGPGGVPYPAGLALTEALAEGVTAPKPATGATMAEIADLAGEGFRAHLGATQAALKPAKPLPESFKSAVLVGAYGGEHSGDMAILGGVLFRMHEQFGLEEAVLLTQRPNHTRHLVDMLETPVSLTVAEYTFPEVARHLETREALIHAGGPLTDIPKQLVRHLYAASLARRAGKPYLIEGIGPTTFKRKASEITARRLLKMADRVMLRTKDDATRPVIQGVDFGVGHDPAFDYLKTRGPELTRLLPGETDEIDALLEGAEGRPLIGVNIRPINDLFTPEAAGRDKAAHTRAVEDQMERNLAAGLAKFAEDSEIPPVFVFFPMNAIQFGKSDNRSAYQITRHLPASVDARVWHSDASLDAVVALIRKLDTVISMRFHATIFALSQNCLPIGIDYRIGQKYKVTAVMEDAGQDEYCCRIDTVDPGWIAARLRDRVDAKAGR